MTLALPIPSGKCPPVREPGKNPARLGFGWGATGPLQTLIHPIVRLLVKSMVAFLEKQSMVKEPTGPPVGATREAER